MLEHKQEIFQPKIIGASSSESGSLCGMEVDIILEGFCNSLSMHGVKYAKVIGNWDNMYKKLLDANPYDNIQIKKIECKNHLLPNVCNRLQDISKDRKYKNVLLRQIICSNRILWIRRAFCIVVCYKKGKISIHPLPTWKFDVWNKKLQQVLERQIVLFSLLFKFF